MVLEIVLEMDMEMDVGLRVLVVKGPYRIRVRGTSIVEKGKDIKSNQIKSHRRSHIEPPAFTSLIWLVWLVWLVDIE